ncbi:uncharacterized protein [Hyperolius riggenbachi]|uniref:uncharacterized protein isoform X2 n=1 Tax=Hyperolius riggenbachi TaxID=752182 RepID=UPI0035A2ADFE
MMYCALLLLMLCLWDRYCGISGQHCVDQPLRTEAVVGGAVTIPCHYAFPEERSTVTSVNVIVRAGNGHLCGDYTGIIYLSENGYLSPDYRGRLSVNMNLSQRMMSVTLAHITKADAKHYCCRVKLNVQYNPYSVWQNTWGTKLLLKDDNDEVLSLGTRPVIYAFPGDNVTLLSQVIRKRIDIVFKVTACNIGSASQYNHACDLTTNRGRCSISENNTLSFKIEQVTRLHHGLYCWIVGISRNGKQDTHIIQGPELRIIGQTNEVKIDQPEETEFQTSTIVNCSFTRPQGRDIIRTEVYWIIGEPGVAFVYHPDPDYILPDYRGKTRLLNGSNLLLPEFHGADNTTFYCLVMMRRCSGYYNAITTILEKGPGTRLRVNAHKGKTSGEIGIEPIPAVAAEAQNTDKAYENLETLRQTQQGGHLLYATVNHSTSITPQNQGNPQEAGSEAIVYAVIKKK